LVCHISLDWLSSIYNDTKIRTCDSDLHLGKLSTYDLSCPPKPHCRRPECESGCFCFGRFSRSLYPASTITPCPTTRACGEGEPSRNSLFVGFGAPRTMILLRPLRFGAVDHGLSNHV
jgi:hypothetical protein